MNLSHESLAPLVGKTVTVTRGPSGSYGPDYIPPGTPVPLCSSCGERHFSLAGCQGLVGPSRVHNDPTPLRYQWSYQWSYKGVEFDFYRLCEILGIKHHAQAHALKKVIRAGRSVKSLETDIDEAVACLVRWKEMILEDKESHERVEQ